MRKTIRMNAMSQQWINEAGTFYPVNGDTRLLASPGDGVFVVVESATPMMKRIGLNRIGDRFDFDFKLYELGTDPIIRLVKKTWESRTFVEGNKNLGVIFNGIKGTGKTLSAKLLCNAIGLPVVIVQNSSDGLLPQAIEEYLDDNLRPDLSGQREKILEQIDLLEISTIDILKALVDEVNIHGALPETPCLNIPVAKFAYEILEFYHLETYESKGEVLSFVREKMAEGGFTSLLEWMNKWESADGKKDAEDLLSEEFEYVCQRSMTSTSSSLWKDSATSLGTIVREPDADGFFVMRPRYEDEDHLCVLLRKKESPSLYRGMLV